MTLILIGMLGYVINQYLLDDGNGTSNGIYITTNNYLSETPRDNGLATTTIPPNDLALNTVSNQNLPANNLDISKSNVNISEQLKKL